MRLSIKNVFVAGAIGFAALFSTICGVVSAEEEKNYTIATGSDLITGSNHLDLIYDVIPVLQDETPANQQHGNINIEGTGLFGEGLGIGTTTPAGILHVVGTTTIFSGTVTASLFVGDGSGLTSVGDGNSLDASDGSPENAVFVDANGNVGIGTTGPSAFLEVTGENEGAWATFISNTDADNGFGLKVRSGDDNNTLAFKVENINTNTLLSVDGDGNVGIGVTWPSAALEVDGGVVPKKVTTDPCGSGYPEAVLFYNDTSDYFCYCNGSGVDKRVYDNGACF